MDPKAIAWAPSALGASDDAVGVRWLGTAGFELTYAGTTLLLDPYLTRASLRRVALSAIAPDEALLRRHFARVDAIVLGHTHFDHALDAPFLAKSTGARVLGSRSASVLCRSQGVPESQIDVVEGAYGAAPIERDVGPFHLRFHPSAHAPILLGRVPLPGDIKDCTDVPLRVEKYRCGAVFGVEIRVAGKCLFHLGSAELLDGQLPRLEADLALVCAAGWTAAHDFPTRAMRALSPRAVLLSHWDNFLLPLAEEAQPLPAMRLGSLVDRLSQAARDVLVGTLPLLGQVRV